MNAVSGTDQPPEGAVSPNNASRRTFLKGVGVAGAAAAGLTAPLLANTSARAGTSATFPQFVRLGVNAPNPWTGPAVGWTWPDLVKGAVGVRHYLNHVGQPGGVLTTSDEVNAVGGWPVVQHPSGTIVPTSPITSIYPDPRVLLDDPSKTTVKAFLDAIKAFILDGMTKAGAGTLIAPQLNTWHEAGHLYVDCNATDASGQPLLWCKYGLSPGNPVTINGKTLGAGQVMRDVHVKMQQLCTETAKANPLLPAVRYGCIIYGDIDLMASDATNDSDHNFVPNAGFPLDWYGIDVYYEGDPDMPGKPSDCHHPNLDSDTAVSDYLGGYLTRLVNRFGESVLGSPPLINICECNANEADADFRPGFFKRLANWLDTNVLGASMLTFFHTTPPDKPAPHSVPWNPGGPNPPYQPAQGTIDALNFIQTTYG